VSRSLAARDGKKYTVVPPVDRSSAIASQKSRWPQKSSCGAKDATTVFIVRVERAGDGRKNRTSATCVAGAHPLSAGYDAII
jgi:hypothetical protein